MSEAYINYNKYVNIDFNKEQGKCFEKCEIESTILLFYTFSLKGEWFCFVFLFFLSKVWIPPHKQVFFLL